MRQTLYAVVAASLAMLATSGLVAMATAAPPRAESLRPAADSVSEHLNQLIERDIAAIKVRLDLAAPADELLKKRLTTL
jgi:hypothetical protein